MRNHRRRWRAWPRPAQDALLAPARGPLQAPIRAALLGAEGFAAHGQALAREHGLPQRAGSPLAFFPRLRDNVAVLREAERAIERQQRLGRPLSPAGEWLQDNIHDVIAQTRVVRDELPHRYYRRLPVLDRPGLAGLPRIYAIAWHYLAHTDGAFDPDLLATFLQAYQSVHGLTQSELWALPTTLRAVLVENLRRLAERTATEEAAREAAHRLCDALAREGGEPAAPEAWFERLRMRGVADAFALQVMQRLHADSETGTAQGAAGREAIRVALAQALPDPAAALESQQAEAAADALSVGHAISSLSRLGRADWRGLITQSSALMQRLLAWPAFAAEHSGTQDASLHEIERLTRRCGCSEHAIAEPLLTLAARAAPVDAGLPTASLGYWLFGAGQAALHAELGLPPPPGPRWLRRALPLLLTSLAALSVGLVLAFMHGAAAPGLGGWLWSGLALLALLPASEAAAALLNRLISESLPPRRLPRLALELGIPPEHRVLVVMPVLLDSAATAAELARRLERHHLANREAHAQFALLSDFADAAEADTAADAPLLAAALAQIDLLNARHPAAPAQPLRFLLLHRPRRWSDSERRWIGWERKRGKLEQLMARLTGGADAFLDFGPRSQPAAGTPHVLTLDSDTVLPPGALRELVAVAAHPLNQPQLGRTAAGLPRVVSGHGILQPRIQVAWPQTASGQSAGPGSLFHRLFAGAAAGHDVYNAVASEVYQDLLDEGSFSGKGLLNVAAVHAVLAGRLPEDQVLSHDLLEGCIARCGSVGDVALIEPAPQHADVASARLHRWTRGDWQLLPLLLRPRRNGLRALDVWKLLDNLRRSLVATAALLLMLLALGGAPLSPWAALALAAAAFAAGPLLGAAAGLVPSRDDIALGHFARVALADLARALAGLAWHLALWLRQSLLSVDAIARALWRSAVSRRGLLAWTTAAASEGRAVQGLPAQLAQKAPLSLLALALGAVLMGLHTPAPVLVLGLTLLWAATPLWVAWASRPVVAPAPPLPDDDREYLYNVARATWDWFATHVGPASNHLPPDNVQAVPRLMVAQRTSPTNIGLYLLATVCARAFGWISPLELLTRLSATLATLECLPRDHGHLLNWIDTATLQPLLPAYVSTVDSGNLCGHLLAVASACEQVGAAEALQRELDGIAQRCRQLAEGHDFAFLYDPQRRLLHIGWQVADHKLDPGHYDLLASESRLASLWAIAKGDVPAAHWAALGRTFEAAGAEVGLKSWSGSMFEYLMPLLVLDEPADSALGWAARMAVHGQRRYAARQRLPWGVSESAYAATDRTLAYQYAPQGVPQLALRRTPADERVVAPYATALAAMLVPQAAVRNLRRLQALKMRTPWGFFEALDCTPSRQADDQRCTRVQTYMAHHQGMTQVALAQVLLDGLPRRWGMADGRLAAVATLLQERVPREVARQGDTAPATPDRGESEALDAQMRDVLAGDEALARTQLLGNAGYRQAAALAVGLATEASRPAYSVSLRANGAGWSRFGDIDLSRWRDDALRDDHGHFLYLRRDGDATPASLTQRPAPDPAARYTARFLPDRVCFDATWPDLHARCTVWVSPEDDVELRRVELWNTSSQPITLELMSAFEVSLSSARADEMHPAFANLFVSADWDAAAQAMFLARRPRRDAEPGQHAVHFIAHAETGGPLAVRALADRARWRGRLREPWQPLADFSATGATATGTLDTGLDPVAALSLPLTLAPHGTAQLTWATAAAADAATLTALVDSYRRPGAVERASQLSATLHALQQRERRLAGEDLIAIQALTSLLVLLHARPDPAPAGLVCDRRLLWRFGLSGERPLVVVTASSVAGLALVQTLIQGLLYWAHGGVGVDLVLINAEPNTYLMPLRQGLHALRERYTPELQHGPLAGRGVLVLLQSVDIGATERATLAQLARLRLNADGRPLGRHVADLLAWHEGARLVRDAREHHSPAEPTPHASVPAASGRFDPLDGGYSFATSLARPTPRPWVNVLANPSFGTLVSESGAGWTWAGNSRLHQLSAWSNDPLADTARERFALQDLRTGEVWNLAPGPGAAEEGYRVEHSPAGTTISHRRGELTVSLNWQVDAQLAAKRVQVSLSNTGSHGRRLRVLGAIEWLLGAVLVDRQSVRTSQARLTSAGGAALDVLLATQLDQHDGTAGQTAFWTLQAHSGDGQDGRDAVLPDWTCDRRELFDERGRPVWPASFGRLAGQGGDPCAALGLSLRLEAGATRRCDFLLGHAASPQAALALAQRLLDGEQGPAETRLDAVQVSSPDPLFDALVNHWLLHQTTACRLWGRAGFYQAGGAYGFRDQLQDAMALVLTAPELLREHLLRAAARQFMQGDVQHWWQPHSGAGVRTRCSDDLLWLAHATHHYIRTTGDVALLEEPVPFIEGDALAADAEDAYTVPRPGGETATLYEHCARAIDVRLGVGVHGLPLIGAGDWNDGMSHVGAGGKGESVWLGWFLCRVVADFAPLAEQRGETQRAARWLAAAQGWRRALAGPAWDGQWYARAFFDDGTPLGTQDGAECRIDLIAQAWSVLSGAAPVERQRQAMASAERLLVDADLRLLRLLDPPLAHHQPSAGYIQAYPPGVRENGGQYTHAVVWAAMAWAELGQADAAWRAWVACSPAHRVADPALGPRFGLEPYAVAADIYSQPPWAGRGGWNWYSGSAAGLYRAAIGSLCGLQVRAGWLRFVPVLPSHWPAVQLTLRRHGRLYRFSLCRADALPDVAAAQAQGAQPLVAGEWLRTDGVNTATHHLVILPPAQPRPAPREAVPAEALGPVV